MDEGIKEQWKIDPAYVRDVKVTRGTADGRGVYRFRVVVEAPQGRYVYTWTYLRQRVDWAVTKREVK